MIFNDAMLTHTMPNDPKPSVLHPLPDFAREPGAQDCSLNITARDDDDDDEDNSDEDEDIPPRMWYDILDGFGKALKRSKNFKFTPVPIRPYSDFSKYNVPDTACATFHEEFGYGCIDPEGMPQRDKVDLEMDTAAFTLIQQAIADRVASMD